MTTRLPVGACGRKFPQAPTSTPAQILTRAHELGLDGVFFRTVFDLDDAADPGVLSEAAQTARDLGLYLEIGFGKVNPYNIAEDGAPRRLGEGDYVRGFELAIQRLAAVGCHDVWADLANWQHEEWGLFAIDRFRTDVTWEDQLRATTRLLRRPRPILLEFGTHLNIETHEEVTTFELVRLVEELGPDVLGITFDSANVALCGELPTDAVRRVAPYVRQTHLRDIVLAETGAGYERQLRACGDGLIDWPALVGELVSRSPLAHLTIEGAVDRDVTDVHWRDPRWRASMADLGDDELGRLHHSARHSIELLDSGRWPGLADYFPSEQIWESSVDFLERSAATLRSATSGWRPPAEVASLRRAAAD